MNDGRTTPRAWEPWLLAVMLVAAVAIRIAATLATGHRSDVETIAGWAETMADSGPLHFYETRHSVYPALLYLYWPLGVLFDGATLQTVVKGSSIPFDLAVGVLAYLLARRWAGGRAGLLAAAAYLFNPAAVIDGPLWGQIDVAGALVMLLAVIALARQRTGTAGALVMLAFLVKPQFGLVGLPVLVLGVVDARNGSWDGVWRPALGGLLVYLVIAAPLGLTPWRYLDQVAALTERHHYTSLYAPSVWGVLDGYRVRDTALQAAIGGVALLLGLAASHLPLLRGRDLVSLLWVAGLMAIAFYLLPTRVHERYLFPAIVLLVPLAATSWRWFAGYAGISVALAAVLVYQLANSSPAAIPGPLRDLVTLPGSVGLQAALLWVSVGLVVYLVARNVRPPAATSVSAPRA